MKNNTLPVESLIKMNQIESRLKINNFLNKQQVPGSLDGRIFKILQKSNCIPSRAQYPNFYHWYIIVRQFSADAIDRWISNSISVTDDDEILVEELLKALQLQEDTNLQTNDSTTNKNNNQTIKNNQNEESFQMFAQPVLKKLQSTQDPEKQAFLKDKCKQHEYILEIKLNVQSPQKVQELEKKINQMIEISKFQMRSEQNQPQVRIHFKSSLDNCQALKDSISNWPQVKNIQFKKLKKQNSKTQAKQAQK